MKIKMEMATAKERFIYAVWHVLNEIEKKRLPNQNKKVFDYMVNIDVRHQARFLFGMERDAIQFLKNKKIIKEIGEPVLVEFGEQGTHNYQVYESYHFKPLNEFDEFYKKQTNLLRKFIEPGRSDEESESEIISRAKSPNGNAVSEQQFLPLPNDVEWKTLEDEFVLKFADDKKLEFTKIEKPTAKYFKLLIENHGIIVKHTKVPQTIPGITKQQIENLVKALRKKIENATLLKRIVFEKEYTGGYKLLITSNKQQVHQ